MSNPLKAYMVREPDEGNCVVVFATNSATARREGGDELGISFEEVESCRREPSFDQYAPGPVPLHATLAAGWWHECQHCQVRFDADGRSGEEEDDEPEHPFEPVQDAKRSNYCCPACVMLEWAERRERKAREAAAVEAAAVRWPTATRITAFERYEHHPIRAHHWEATITLPGVEDPVSWRIGAGTVNVSQRSVGDFKRLYTEPANG